MGGKEWNVEKGIWEIDGTPVIYRVTWKVIDSGEERTRDFTDIDQGHEFYQDQQKSPYAYRVTWEHIPW